MTSSLILRKLASYPRQNALALALREFGRIERTLFTLDWRFLRKWSLETTVGDAGTSILDLIWQHRY